MSLKSRELCQGAKKLTLSKLGLECKDWRRWGLKELRIAEIEMAPNGVIDPIHACSNLRY